MPKINIFDHTTYLEISIYCEQDILFPVLSHFAPEWLLGSRRFTNRLHSNLDLDVPKRVIDTFSAGLKYISPIAMKKSLVKELWAEFCDRAYKSWDKSLASEMPMEELNPEDSFYNIPIPFVLKGLVEPYKGTPDKRIISILQSGWTELNTLLSNVPNLDRNNRSVDVESKDAFKWCFENNVLIKPTDKNLGTALVSTVWYDEKVSSFITNNKGYAIVSEEEAHTLLQRQIMRIRDLMDNKTTKAFTGYLPRFFGSRLPPLQRQKDPWTGEEIVVEDKWEEIIVTLPVFVGLPKIHKSPWGICPIIPCHSVVQGLVSEFLSKILKTLLADHLQILTSTKELVCTLESSVCDKLSCLSPLQWKNNVYICTADIEGFYTNVPINECASKLEDLVLTHFGYGKRSSRVKAVIKRGMNHRELLIGGMGNGLD